MEKKVSLTLILKEKVQKLLDDFATVMNIHIVFYGRDGSVLRQGRDEGNSRFCHLMQTHYFSIQDCLDLDEKMEAKCAMSRCCECYTCHAGLCEAVMPVIAPGGQLLGFLMFGQFRCRQDLPDSFRTRKISGKAKKELEESYFSLPFYSDEAVKKMSGLLELLVDYIVRCELVTLGDNPVYARLCDYIDSTFQSRLTIGKAARAMRMSVSGLSHALHASGHPSFIEILNGRRLVHAEYLLAHHPEMTIAEVASRSGFQDPFYFSRVYRKSRNCTPGEYRGRNQRLILQ